MGFTSKKEEEKKENAHKWGASIKWLEATEKVAMSSGQWMVKIFSVKQSSAPQILSTKDVNVSLTFTALKFNTDCEIMFNIDEPLLRKTPRTPEGSRPAHLSNN